jgi:hypothetical protein
MSLVYRPHHQRAYFIWHLKLFWSDMWRVAAAKVLCWQHRTRPNAAVCRILFSLGNFFSALKCQFLFLHVLLLFYIKTIKYSTYVINVTASLLTLYLLSENVMVKTYRNMVHVLRTTLFWVITQRVVIIPYWRFGTTGPETSARNCHHSLSNNAKECSLYILRDGSLISRVIHVSIRTAWDGLL